MMYCKKLTSICEYSSLSAVSPDPTSPSRSSLPWLVAPFCVLRRRSKVLRSRYVFDHDLALASDFAISKVCHLMLAIGLSG